MAQNDQSKRTGDRGEDYIESLCELPIGQDFLFRGPMYLTGQGHRELSDIFILFGDYAILIQIKTSDATRATERTEGQWVKYANTKLEKTVEQHAAGLEAIRDGHIKEITNERQGTVKLNNEQIKKIFCISVVDHPTLDKWGQSPLVTHNGESVSVMTTTHQEMSHLFRELSTAKDLIDYLAAREKFFQKHMLLGTSELDLLAFYKQDPDKFLELVESTDQIILTEGYWDSYAERDQRSKRSVSDMPSYIIDDLINAMHHCNGSGVPHLEKLAGDHQLNMSSSNYEPIATALASMGRVSRRIAGKKLLELSKSCVKEDRNRYFASKKGKEELGVIVFLVSQETREERAKTMMFLAQSALYHFESRPVVVVGIPPIDPKSGFNIDAMLVDQPYKFVRENLPAEAVELLPKFGDPVESTETEF